MKSNLELKREIEKVFNSGVCEKSISEIMKEVDEKTITRLNK